MKKTVLRYFQIIFILAAILQVQIIHAQNSGIAVTDNGFAPMVNPARSEERRVGKEGRSRWSA